MSHTTGKIMRMFQDLQSTESILEELNLALATRSRNQEELLQYNEMIEKRNELKEQVESDYGS